MIIANQRNRLVGNLLRRCKACGLGYDLIHGIDVDQCGLVQPNRSLGAQDFQHRLVDARFGNFAAADRSQQPVVRAVEIERQQQHVIARFHRFDRSPARGFGSFLGK